MAEEPTVDYRKRAVERKASIKWLRVVEDNITLKLVSRLSQVAILFKKRWTIQKRDKKGFLFQICFLIVAVAIALVFSALDLVGNQPPLKLTPSLYSIAKRVGRTNMLVIGRMHPGPKYPSMEEAYYTLEKGIRGAYPDVSVNFVEDRNNSTALSHYILDTYNDHDHAWRFGSLVFNDALDINITMSIGDIRHIMKTVDPAVIGRNGVVTVHRNWLYEFGLSDVADLVYLIGLEEEHAINMVSVFVL